MRGDSCRSAAYAGTLIKVEYAAEPPAVFSRDGAKEAVDPPQFLWPVASSVGDAGKLPARLARCRARSESPLTEPTAATQPWRRQPLFMLHRVHSECPLSSRFCWCMGLIPNFSCHSFPRSQGNPHKFSYQATDQVDGDHARSTSACVKGTLAPAVSSSAATRWRPHHVS